MVILMFQKEIQSGFQNQTEKKKNNQHADEKSHENEIRFKNDFFFYKKKTLKHCSNTHY